MTYNTDFICTYKLMDDDFSKDYLFKIQMLQAFGLEQWNDTLACQIVNATFDKVKDNEVFREIFEKAEKNKDIHETIECTNEMDTNEMDPKTIKNKIIFQLLFRYDTFDLIHRCLSDYLREGKVKESTQHLILKNL